MADSSTAGDTPSRPGPPSRWKMAVVTWLAIYPTITVLLAIFEPLGLLDEPIAIRTLLLTVVLVPLMAFVLAPTLVRVLGGWLRS